LSAPQPKLWMLTFSISFAWSTASTVS
jgi:hypothetical protein